VSAAGGRPGKAAVNLIHEANQVLKAVPGTYEFVAGRCVHFGGGPLGLVVELVPDKRHPPDFAPSYRADGNALFADMKERRTCACGVTWGELGVSITFAVDDCEKKGVSAEPLLLPPPASPGGGRLAPSRAGRDWAVTDEVLAGLRTLDAPVVVLGDSPEARLEGHYLRDCPHLQFRADKSMYATLTALQGGRFAVGEERGGLVRVVLEGRVGALRVEQWISVIRM